MLKTDSNIIFFPPNGRYEGEKHYICKFLEIPAVILRSLNNRRQANNRSTAEEESLAYGIGNMTVKPQSVVMACLDFEFLEEWILFVIASYCELKTD
ncbi:hypothetical protein ST44_11015 [Prevotella pectinovora]|uniref:Uncharacterized protein n=1 Tax=Prevotella pectinovora TaxID=1602169 RepID=A0A0D0IRR6_9BACT|nr:hypothetical protein ST44_11015 [Prevotella pectinovora]